MSADGPAAAEADRERPADSRLDRGPVLEARAVAVRLGGRSVVRGVDLAVCAGEVLGLFGPSGAGKSTLMRALAGEEPLAAGAVSLGGVDVTAMPLWERARRGLGYVPQTPSVLFDLSARDNLRVFASVVGRTPADRKAAEDRAHTLAGRLGLAGRLEVLASQLSGGERRRLELARALVAAPRVLLCDEPFAAIDPRGTEAVGRALRACADAGSAVLLSDHHVAAALPLCDRAALLLEGELAVAATPDAFASSEEVRRHYAFTAEPTPPVGRDDESAQRSGGPENR